jgi:hypothetical protein
VSAQVTEEFSGGGVDDADFEVLGDDAGFRCGFGPMPMEYIWPW